MKPSDLARLSEPYRKGECSTHDRALLALGIPMRRWKALEALVVNDFAEHYPYGIGWWAPHPGTSRRILISDQLYACLSSVSANMTEAVLHWLEYQDCTERDSERFADVVQIRDGQFDLVMPEPRNALDELSGEMVLMHIAGMARALSASFDCLASVIVGVMAFPVPILTAGLGAVGVGRTIGKFFAKIGQGKTDGEKAQAEFYAKFKEVIASVGPDGWLEWALDFRHMLVHRGRRVQNSEFVQKLPELYGPHGERVLRARRLTYLPRNPSMSDVEAWRAAPMTSLRDPIEPLVLNEDAGQTLGGLLESTKAMISETAKLLIEVWKWRRDNPHILTQPAEQWPKVATTPVSAFKGYAPRSRDLSPLSASGRVPPIVQRRFLAASLDDASRSQWDTFD